jgi:hypothetical protein
MGLADDLAMLQQYAAGHGLELHAAPPQTAAAAAMSSTTSNVTLTGILGDGVVGTIAVLAAEASYGGTSMVTNLVRVSFVMPETLAYVPTLICHPPGFGMDVMADQLIGQWVGGQHLRTEHFESVALDRRFDIEVNPRQDPIWLRVLFPPTFIDWLAQQAPPRLIFALDRGVLHVGNDDPALDPAGLDRLVAIAVKVAGRIKEQCSEEAASGHSTALAPLSSMKAAERPRLLPQGAAARYSLGCSMFASSVFVFLLALVVGSLVLWGVVGGFRKAVGVSAVIGVVLALATARYVVRGARGAAVQELAVRPGDQDVVQQYAAARLLAVEDPAVFHARCNGLALPAAAAYVLDGPLPAVGKGTLAICVDASNPLQSVNWNVCVVDLVDGVPAPTGSTTLQVATRGQTVALSARGSAHTTAAELDGFLAGCAQALGRTA